MATSTPNPDDFNAAERRYADAQRIAQMGSWERDLTSGTVCWSLESCRILGIEPRGSAGLLEAFLAVVHPDDRPAVALRHAAWQAGPATEVEYRVVRRDGATRTIRERAEVVEDRAGTPLRVVGSIQDVTERAAAEVERMRLVAAVEQTADSIWMQDRDGMVTYVNPAFTRVYGYAPEEIVGRYAGLVDSGRHDKAFFTAIWSTAGAGRTWSGSIVNRAKDGRLFEVEAVISAMHDTDGRFAGYMQTDRDVTRERELESTFRRHAREREAIAASLARIDPAASAEETAAAACVAVGRLSGVDSTWAAVLEEEEGTVLAASGPLQAAFTPGTLVPASRTRYLRERGSVGPWFEAWRARIEDGAWAEAVGSTGLRAMAYAPLRGPRGMVGIVGIGSHDTATTLELVEHVPALATFASILGAMLEPKLAGRHRDAAGRSAIQQVLDQSSFRPFFQPIVELETGLVVGYEALTRFADGRRPDLVFAAADRVGLGLELEQATLAAAISAADNLAGDVYLSLNASPALIEGGYAAALLAGQVRPIVLEITEHVAIGDYLALRRALVALRPTVALAVDDAGAGFASLRHIIELAPDYVKLDTGLIRGLDHDPAREALVAGMAHFAATRNVHLVAEGIETEPEQRALRDLGVRYGQGYLFGRPSDARKAASWPRSIALSDGLPAS